MRIFGILSVGIWGAKAGWSKLFNQLIGVISIGGFVLATTTFLWFILKRTTGIRVSTEEEYEGLDIGEHAMDAYPSFERIS